MFFIILRVFYNEFLRYTFNLDDRYRVKLIIIITKVVLHLI